MCARRSLSERDLRRLSAYITACEDRIAQFRGQAAAYATMLARHANNIFDNALDAAAIRPLPDWQSAVDLPATIRNFLTAAESEENARIDDQLKQVYAEAVVLRQSELSLEGHRRLAQLQLEECNLGDQFLTPFRRIEYEQKLLLRTTEVIGDNEKQGGGQETNRYAALEQQQPVHRQAYLAFKYAETKNGRRMEDREAYEWLKEYGIEDCGFEGYELPAFDTWCRYLRVVRKATNERKYTPRSGRR